MVLSARLRAVKRQTASDIGALGSPDVWLVRCQKDTPVPREAGLAR